MGKVIGLLSLFSPNLKMAIFKTIILQAVLTLRNNFRVWAFFTLRIFILHTILYISISIRNDIAIMRLADGVYDNGFVEIAEFPYPGETVPHDFACYITGWGMMDCK